MSVSVHHVLNDPSSTARDERDAGHAAPQAIELVSAIASRHRPPADSMDGGQLRG